MTGLPTLLVYTRLDPVALTTVFETQGLAVQQTRALAAFTASDISEAEALLGEPIGCLVLEPISWQEADAEIADIKATLGVCFVFLTAAMHAFVARGVEGRVVVLLPSMAAMGDPARPHASAIAGALLSLCRTFALEGHKLGLTINTVLFGSEADGTTLREAADVARQVATFARAGRGINGQEVFVVAGADRGRLHP